MVPGCDENSVVNSYKMLNKETEKG